MLFNNSMTTKQEWIKNFESVHTFNKEEIEICRQAKVILSDSRYIGSWGDAVKQAVDFLFDDIEYDDNAMRVNHA